MFRFGYDDFKLIEAIFSWIRNGKSCVLSCLFWFAFGQLYLLVSYCNLPNIDFGQNMLQSKYSITFNLENIWMQNANWSKSARTDNSLTICLALLIKSSPIFFNWHLTAPAGHCSVDAELHLCPPQVIMTKERSFVFFNTLVSLQKQERHQSPAGESSLDCRRSAASHTYSNLLMKALYCESSQHKLSVNSTFKRSKTLIYGTWLAGYKQIL